MSQSLLAQSGAQPQKNPKYAALFIDKAFTGIFTQRSVLHDPSDIMQSHYYGGRPDCLWLGSSNIELTNRLTLARRPGLTPFSISTYPTPPDRAYAFELTNGTIQVMIDTGSTGDLTVTSVDNASNGVFSVVQSGAGVNGSGTTLSSAVNASNQLIFAVAFQSFGGLIVPQVTSVTDTAGNTWMLLSKRVASTPNFNYWLYICTNPAASPVTVTANTSGANGPIMGVVMEVDGLVGAAFDTTSSAIGTNQTTLNSGMSTATTAAEEVVIGFGWVNLSATLVDGAGYIGINSASSGGVTVAAQYQIVSTIGQQQSIQTSNGTSSHWLEAVATFKLNTTTAVYHGLFPNGGSNSYAGLNFLISGFSNAQNNGTFIAASSSTTTLTLYNPVAVAETKTVTAISSGAVYYDPQTSQSVLVFAKSPGAGQMGFQAVAGVLYMGDGVDTVTYTPDNPNGTVWNWGITAPTNPPTLASIVESGSTGVAWAAHTVFSTMGFIVDANGNVEQLISVNANPLVPNTTQIGTTGSGQPNWNQALGGTTSDNGITWLNVGQVTLWTANTMYTATEPIYDPASGGIYVVNGASSVMSGNTRPAFTGIADGFVSDSGGFKWACINNITDPEALGANTSGISPWQPSFAYAKYDTHPGSIVEPIALPTTSGSALPTQPIFLQITENSGTSGTGYTPPWPTLGTIGQQTGDNNLLWQSLGSATWAAHTSYSQWTVGQSIFSAIKDSNSNMQVCIITGVSGTTQPTWGTGYGDTTIDGTVTWSCVGQAMTWVTGTMWYLPAIGFSPPIPNVQPYGGASVVDSNGNVEYVIESGKSGASAPSWNAKGIQTTDGTITWYNLGPFSANTLTWQFGFTYAYSFESRLANDIYNTTPPPGLSKALGTPTGSESGQISTASPVLTITGSNTGAVINIAGLGSTDPQVDTIVIWRSPDQVSGSDSMLFLTEIPNPVPKNGIAQPWSFQDYLPDLPTGPPTNFPGLNPLLPAPIDDSNDPPLSNFIPMAYNFQRIWGAAGQEVLWSGGPDTITGNPNQSFNPADNFPYLANVTRIMKTAQALVILLTDSVEAILGGPTTASFYTTTLAPGIGLNSFNAADIYAGEIFFLSSDSEFKVINPTLQLSNTGFAIGDQLAILNSSNAYVAIQQAAIDNAVYIADGATGWWRCNPRQVPGGASGAEPVWSPFATITNGCRMVQSVEVSPGIRKLLVGSVLPNQLILERNLNVWTDNGIEYPAYMTMGAIMLAHQGQLAILKHIAADFGGQGITPTISYLLDEIAGSFTEIPDPIFDPPALYGTTLAPISYSPLRYYFAGTGQLARCRFLQLRIDFGLSSNGDELLDLCIVGKLMVEV